MKWLKFGTVIYLQSTMFRLVEHIFLFCFVFRVTVGSKTQRKKNENKVFVCTDSKLRKNWKIKVFTFKITFNIFPVQSMLMSHTKTLTFENKLYYQLYVHFKCLSDTNFGQDSTAFKVLNGCILLYTTEKFRFYVDDGLTVLIQVGSGKKT